MKTHTRNRNLLFVISLLVTIPLLFAFCSKKDGKTYYKIKGEGYVFYEESGKPVEGAVITVITGIDWDDNSTGGIFSPPSPVETYTTDANGYYQVRFIKKVYNEKVKEYRFRIEYNESWAQKLFTLYRKDIENAKQNMLFDTIKIPQEILY